MDLKVCACVLILVATCVIRTGQAATAVCYDLASHVISCPASLFTEYDFAHMTPGDQAGTGFAIPGDRNSAYTWRAV